MRRARVLRRCIASRCLPSSVYSSNRKGRQNSRENGKNRRCLCKRASRTPLPAAAAIRVDASSTSAASVAIGKQDHSWLMATGVANALCPSGHGQDARKKLGLDPNTFLQVLVWSNDDARERIKRPCFGIRANDLFNEAHVRQAAARLHRLMPIQTLPNNWL